MKDYHPIACYILYKEHCKNHGRSLKSLHIFNWSQKCKGNLVKEIWSIHWTFKCLDFTTLNLWIGEFNIEKKLDSFYRPINDTSCAMTKAIIRSAPGRSTNDQLLDLVTKMSAWLMILTWRYTAPISSSLLSLIDFTPNLSCISMMNFSFLRQYLST